MRQSEIDGQLMTSCFISPSHFDCSGNSPSMIPFPHHGFERDSKTDDTVFCIRFACRFIVVDGHFITTDQLVLNGSVSVAPAHVIFGWMADDGTDFAGSFPANSTSQTASVEGIGYVTVSSLVLLPS